MLIKCPECRKELSDQSKKCQYCGYPLKRGIQIRKFIKFFIRNRERKLLWKNSEVITYGH